MQPVFAQHITALFGESGEKWLSALPSLVQYFETLWSCRAGEPFLLNYNYVVPVVLADTTHAVLKIGHPESKEFLTEIDALTTFNGCAAVKVLKEDREKFAVLLEKAIPGENLLHTQHTDDVKATTIVTSVIKKLHKSVVQTHTFPTVAEWGKAFDMYTRKFGEHGPIPKDLFIYADSLYKQLLDTTKTEVLLHGDLHYENILSSSRESWLAIDPKGVIGDPAFETGILLRNPYPDFIKLPNVEEIVKTRIMQLAFELDFDAKRIWGWGFSQAVLSALWVVEDRQQYLDYYLQSAYMLLKIKNSIL